MFLHKLGLRNFRNFENEEVEFPPGGAALIGGNGEGKTSLLEAIYYLEIFRSFRGARDEQLIKFGAGHFRVEGQLVGDDGTEEVVVAAGYAREGRRKKITVNGGEPSRLSGAIGRVGAVVFTASDIEMVSGGPGARRRFLDIVLSLVEPGYLMTLQRYRQILSQRNELLRDGTRPSELSAWDQGLVESGSRLLEARARWVGSVRCSFSRRYATVSGGDRAEIEYGSSVSIARDREGAATPPIEEWAKAFEAAIERQSDLERRKGLTVIGPHRDDLKFWLVTGGDFIDLRAYGSAGQQRTAAIVLRLVEAETLRKASGRQPIVMLDDVFAELDPSRAERITELVGEQEWGQVIVTSPKPDEFAWLGGRLQEYRIENGRVRAL